MDLQRRPKSKAEISKCWGICKTKCCSRNNKKNPN